MDINKKVQQLFDAPEDLDDIPENCEVDIEDYLDDEPAAEDPSAEEVPEDVSDDAADGDASDEDTPEDAPKDGKQRLKDRNPQLAAFLDWVLVIAIAVAFAVFLNFFVIINSVVPTGSMEPTIMSHSREIGLRLSYVFGEPERGDIIIFRYPGDPSELYVKRIVGMPGDTLEIVGGVTYINGEELAEPYLAEQPQALDFGPYEVPEGHYFVMGDNRNHSIDSRLWDADTPFVSREAIQGKAVLCYWPPSQMKILK